jgi:gamma-glutamyltranspeptidase/glutathione hydrolase
LRNLGLALAFVLASCGGSETSNENLMNPTGQPPSAAPLAGVFRGGGNTFAAVSADESKAAEVGRDILSAGGNATDAAVAMYFAMAVTLPSAAGLGATGACVVHDSKTRAGESFVFAPVAAPGPINGVTFAVPSGVRAVTLMHVRHGQMRWEATVAPAERLARVGVPVSRALSRDLQVGAASLGADSEARRIYGRGTGTAVTEGDHFVQLDLAATLGIIRSRGGADFFAGTLARTISDQVSRMGGSLTLESLRNTIPVAGAPLSQDYRGFKVYVAPSPMAGPRVLAGWNGEPEPPASVSTNSEGISGFVVVDSKGGAAACSLSMGQVFGARMIVPGTGIMLGAITANSTAVSPMVIGNPGNGEFRYVGAGGGSPDAAYATGAVARATLRDGKGVGEAMAARGGRGGWVDAIACPDGIRGGAHLCRSAIDPSGSGMALVAPTR